MNESISLYRKIAAVMKDIGYLSKDDSIEFKSTKYKAISEEKVTSAVRASLIEHGLIVLPVSQAHKREDMLTTVDTTYKIIDIDTGAYELIVSSGTGVDTQDKGVGKAMTYAYKYLFLRTFAIPTGEDPDKISSTELDEKQKKDEEKRQKDAEADEAIYPQLKIKWQVLAGDLSGFDEWYDKRRGANQTNAQLNETLAKKLMDKNESDKKTKAVS